MLIVRTPHDLNMETEKRKSMFQLVIDLRHDLSIPHQLPEVDARLQVQYSLSRAPSSTMQRLPYFLGLPSTPQFLVTIHSIVKHSLATSRTEPLSDLSVRLPTIQAIQVVYKVQGLATSEEKGNRDLIGDYPERVNIGASFHIIYYTSNSSRQQSHRHEF